MAQSSNRLETPNRPLRALIHDRHVQVHVENAEFIRGYPDCPERTEEAEQYVRLVMREFTVGTLTDQERARILAILEFAVPPLPAYLANPDPPPWTSG